MNNEYYPDNWVVLKIDTKDSPVIKHCMAQELEYRTGRI